MGRFSFLFPAVIVLNLTVGCNKEKDNYLYEITEIELQNADNSAESPVISTADSIASKAYAIELTSSIILAGADGDFLDKIESGYKNKYSLTYFNIRALEYFDAAHPAGTSLNNYFLFGYAPIENLVKGNYLGGPPPYRSSEPQSWESTDYIMLMKNPEENGVYHFVIDIQYSGGFSSSDTIAAKLYL